MKITRILALVCALALLLSLAGCGTENNSASTPQSTAGETADLSGQTITGQVVSIQGTNVILQPGTLNADPIPSEENGRPSSGEEPPEKPDSAQSDSSGNGQLPPDAPSAASGQKPPELPSGGNMSSGGMPMAGAGFTASGDCVTLDFSGATISKNGSPITLSEIAAGDILTVTVGDGGAALTVNVEAVKDHAPGNPSGFGSGEFTQGTSANTISEDGSYSGGSYLSSGSDENALRIDGAAVTLDAISVDKSGGATSNTENGDFYGVNAALLATGGATVSITNSTITSSAQNGNGVFSYGSGTTVNISDSTITTSLDNSGGIQTTGGGITNASNLIVTTAGNSSAAIRSDRGGGTVTVNGGTYSTSGYNSPAIYSTAAITVQNASLTADYSEALVIEGKNSITLDNCDIVGNMSSTSGSSSSENVHNIMIYQSMSGDADIGTSALSITGGSLLGKNGDMFYVTNTHCILTLSNVQIENQDTSAYFLRVTGNSASRGWGTAGSNGAQVDFTADNQTIDGTIVVDTISSLKMTLKNGSIFTGAVNIINNAEGGSVETEHAEITVEVGCTWNLTGDCTITTLTNHGTIVFNGYTITLADGTVLNG